VVATNNIDEILSLDADVVLYNPPRERYEVWPELDTAMQAGGSSLCHEIESIEVKTCERQSTMSPIFIEKFGFGRTEEDLRAGEDLRREVPHRKGNDGRPRGEGPIDLPGCAQGTMEVRFLIGTDWVSPEFLAEAPEQGWLEVKINGTPQHRFFHEMLETEKIVRTRSTGTKAVNAIPSVVNAAAGLVLPSAAPMPRIL
jgi:hypothetical protein